MDGKKRKHREFDDFERPFDASDPNIEVHQCESFRNGDWIIFRCSHMDCGYELRENWRTGECTTHNETRHVHHQGNYFPMEYKEAFENVN